jgi:hypothetical protein
LTLVSFAGGGLNVAGGEGGTNKIALRKIAMNQLYKLDGVNAKFVFKIGRQLTKMDKVVKYLIVNMKKNEHDQTEQTRTINKHQTGILRYTNKQSLP